MLDWNGIIISDLQVGNQIYHMKLTVGNKRMLSSFFSKKNCAIWSRLDRQLFTCPWHSQTIQLMKMNHQTFQSICNTFLFMSYIINNQIITYYTDWLLWNNAWEKKKVLWFSIRPSQTQDCCPQPLVLWWGFYAKLTKLFTDCKVFKYRHLMVKYVTNIYCLLLNVWDHKILFQLQ